MFDPIIFEWLKKIEKQTKLEFTAWLLVADDQKSSLKQKTMIVLHVQ